MWTTRVDPRHGNGGIHFQLATDQNGNSIQNCRVLQMLSCVTGNSDEPAGNRGSCKSQFDGNPGRSNMQKAAPWGDAAKVWPGRDYSLEEVAKHMQDFVQYLIDEDSPLAERYGNKVPTDEEAIVIAKRMGGAMLPSQGWPNPTTIFMRQAGQVDADRFPLNRFWARWADANCIWDACLQDPDWSLAMENENKEVGYNVKETLYALHGGVCQSGDIMNMGNIARAWDATTQLDFFVDINLWFCPNNGNADIIFPCQHWMELDSTRVSQGSGGMFGCCCAAIEPPGETIYDPDWNVGMYKAMGVPWNTKDPDAAPAENLNYAPQCQTFIDKWTEQLGDDYDASGAPSYLWPDHDRVLKDNVDKWCTAEFPEGPTWAEAKQWFTDHGWMDCREWHPERWGTFRRHEMGWRRQQGGFNLFPLVDFHPGFMTASGLVEIWSLVCEAYICNMGEVPEDSDKWAHSDLPQFQGDDDRFPIYREPTDSPVAKPELYDAALVDPGRRHLLHEPRLQGHPEGHARQRLPDDHGFPPAHLLPLRASPAALVPRGVAVSPHRDEPEGRRAPRPQAGRLGVDRDAVGQGPRGARFVLRHLPGRSERQPCVVVPRVRYRLSWLRAGGHQRGERPLRPGHRRRLRHDAFHPDHRVQGHGREFPVRQSGSVRSEWRRMYP